MNEIESAPIDVPTQPGSPASIQDNDEIEQNVDVMLNAVACSSHIAVSQPMRPVVCHAKQTAPAPQRASLCPRLPASQWSIPVEVVVQVEPKRSPHQQTTASVPAPRQTQPALHEWKPLRSSDLAPAMSVCSSSSGAAGHSMKRSLSGVSTPSPRSEADSQISSVGSLASSTGVSVVVERSALVLPVPGFPTSATGPASCTAQAGPWMAVRAC